ncbi:MAG: hypothetical protein NT004_02530 [Bacteroidetes bacterium]|nr:hypothetical protein [Bacteroidota bacterium]
MKKLSNSLTITILIMVFFILVGFNPGRSIIAQSPMISLGNIGICNYEPLLIPLNGKNLANIGAITLFIYFDSEKLIFRSLENINSKIIGLQFNVLNNPSCVSIVWSNTKGVNFPDNLLLYIKFDVINSSGMIKFAIDSCEIAVANIPPEIIPVEYLNGSFYSKNPIITENPENITVFCNSNAHFNITSLGSTEYLWQASVDAGNSWIDLEDGASYSGTTSTDLAILNVPVTFNNNRYRCSVTRENCSLYSTDALLSVDSLSWISEIGNSGMVISNFPNPFSERTRLSYYVPKSGEVTIDLFTLIHNRVITIIKGFHLTGLYIIELNLVYLPNELYLCQYKLETNQVVAVRNRKIIKK